MQDNNEILLDNVDIEIPVVENLIEIPIDHDKIKADTIRLKNLLKNVA